jgi:hypothetical protein
LPGDAAARRPAGGSGKPRARRSAGSSSNAPDGGRRRGSGAGLRVSRQQRATEDGYSSPLLPGVRASADAQRLADELAFANGRLLALGGEQPEPLPDLYAEIRALAGEDLEQATWACFLTAYLSPLEGPEPFSSIRAALGRERDASEDLSELPRGPRASTGSERGGETLRAYRGWYEQADRSKIGQQASAFAGDPAWSAERRFERVFERLALPGLTRAVRYDLLVLLGTLGPYELRAPSLELSGAKTGGVEDATTLAAKRVFAIGDALLLERRAAALAEAVPVPLAALELALWNWGGDRRATLGFPQDVADEDTRELAFAALGL